MTKLNLSVPGSSLLLAIAMAGSVATPAVLATPSMSGGVWFNYEYEPDNKTHDDTLGSIESETLILYINDHKEGSPWSMDAEVRFGPGAFTRPAENSTGDNFGFHQLNISYALSDSASLSFGKIQLPWAWKKANFWPGHMLMGGYGDQMDLGVRYSASSDDLKYSVGYFHSDDWGETSTDTMDDNGKWGSPTTYRKVHTLAADASLQVAEGIRVGASVQAGQLQDLTGTEEVAEVDGSHSAGVLYYTADFDLWKLKGQYLMTKRELPENAGGQDISSKRAALEVAWGEGPWYLYLDSNWANSKTDGDKTKIVNTWAPGVRYNYGPGWVYVEYLSMQGYVGRDGNIVEDSDYDAMYVTVDYYF